GKWHTAQQIVDRRDSKATPRAPRGLRDAVAMDDSALPTFRMVSLEKLAYGRLRCGPPLIEQGRRVSRSSEGCSMKLRYQALVAVSSVLTGCHSEGKSDDQFQADIMSGIHDILLSDVRGVHQAALDLQAAAPTPSGRGWDASQDATAIEAMKQAW